MVCSAADLVTGQATAAFAVVAWTGAAPKASQHGKEQKAIKL